MRCSPEPPRAYTTRRPDPRHLLLVGVQPVELEDHGGSLRGPVKHQIEPAITLVLDYLAGLGVRPLEGDGVPAEASVDLPHPSLHTARYEAGRPGADAACRVGDARFLRERRVDIPAIARVILDNAIRAFGKEVRGFTDEALSCLQGYHWPGNVRELQNEVHRMLVMSREPILGADLLNPRVLRAAPRREEGFTDLLADLQGSLKDRVAALEARILRETLIRHRWNKSRAADELGLSRVGLRNKLERYGLAPKTDA